MTVKVSIIGLGQIGASIGLALANHKDQVNTSGYDSSLEVARQAQKIGAVEDVNRNLSAAIKGADMVILAVPMDQVKETLKVVAQDVRENGLVIDTAPVKMAVAEWAKEYMPSGRHYIGLTPALNPLVLDDTATGIEAARADLFQNGLIAVSAPHGTASDAYQLAASFVALLGARALFVDLAEVDGIMATIHTLPAMVAAALTETILKQPGWADIRKLGGRPFVSSMRPLDLQESVALAEAVRQNRANIVRLLGDTIATLESWRDEIGDEKEKSFHGHLDRIVKGRSHWRRERSDGDWQSIENFEQEIPTFSDLFMQQLGLGKLLGGLRKPKKEED